MSLCKSSTHLLAVLRLGKQVITSSLCWLLTHELSRVALEQAHRRGWVTYTDLTTIWEHSDVQLSMLKQTAKVILTICMY